MSRAAQIRQLEQDWAQNPRWADVRRGYQAADVIRLRGSLQPEYTLARRAGRRGLIGTAPYPLATSCPNRYSGAS